MRRRFLLACLGTASLTALMINSTVPPTPTRPWPASPVPASAADRLDQHRFAVPPSPDQCQAIYGIVCYSPDQLRRAYGTEPLFRQGVTGLGQTIAVVASFGSPTVEHDLRVFDQVWGLPDPPSIRTITPAGPVPPFDPADDDMAGWALETTLDVAYAHLMAPRADILVVATPVAETEGVVGFPEIVAAENYLIDNGMADVISQSFGAAEQTFPDSQSILALRSAFLNAENHGVTVLAAAGDSGATDLQNDQQSLYSYQVDSWPSSDPLVTSVGGTKLSLDASGHRTAPDEVWNDDYGAGGGGVSTVFDRPAYQNSVQDVVGERRGTPDVAMSAAIDGGVLVYTSYDEDDVGWGIVGGTSEATPMFAGVVALAAQLAGHRLGLINPALYSIAEQGEGGIVDVAEGDNSFGDVAGFDAAPGYDLASGLGSIDASLLVPELAAAARAPAG
jgi:subtilase family serine protease